MDLGMTFLLVPVYVGKSLLEDVVDSVLSCIQKLQYISINFPFCFNSSP